MYLVGLTGGIGSGKSTVAAALVERGVEVIDADAVAREVVQPDGPALGDLVERFGTDILSADGTLDRSALAALAFASDDARADLDRITHPHIAARIAQRVAELAVPGDRGGAELVVVDHPLLVETGQSARFDAVVVVVADEEQRVRRLVEQRGLPEHDVRARIAAQADDEARRAVATHVIDNDGSRELLLERTVRLHDDLLAAARRSRGPDRDTPGAPGA